MPHSKPGSMQEILFLSYDLSTSLKGLQEQAAWQLLLQGSCKDLRSLEQVSVTGTQGLLQGRTWEKRGKAGGGGEALPQACFLSVRPECLVQRQLQPLGGVADPRTLDSVSKTPGHTLFTFDG